MRQVPVGGVVGKSPAVRAPGERSRLWRSLPSRGGDGGGRGRAPLRGCSRCRRPGRTEPQPGFPLLRANGHSPAGRAIRPAFPWVAGPRRLGAGAHLSHPPSARLDLSASPPRTSLWAVTIVSGETFVMSQPPVIRTARSKKWYSRRYGTWSNVIF